jgi:hypothetical protein
MRRFACAECLVSYDASSARLTRGGAAPMAERPDVVRDRRHLRRRELGPAHRRHRASELLRIRNAVGDDLGDRLDAAIAPQPFRAGEIRPQRCALGIGAMAAGAGARAINPAAQCNIRGCGAGSEAICDPASGCTPSGGPAAAVEALPPAGAGAGAIAVTAVPPRNTMRQMRPR